MASTSNSLDEALSASRARAAGGNFLYTFPWWLLLLLLAGIYVVILIFSTELYRDIFNELKDGILMTLTVAFTAYLLALTVGLIIALIRANPPQPGHGLGGKAVSFLRLVLFQMATLYVSVLRGLPMLVILLIVAFVIVPAVVNSIQATIAPQFNLRGSSPPSAVIALALAYAAFLSETLRAGIQSIEKGQTEAARSLGMTYFQTMRYIILPQAIRRVLPPMGNDFISMIKDSSLVTVLGINDITQNAKLWSSATFRFAETYFVASMIYLTMTVLGSLLIRYLERRFSYGR
ncbi:MAG: amino acid ABC transporter permease [Chloroflexi bacterium]|nr:amino acid ABC transporter permease [Chloroflexota bacterium]